MQNYPESQDFVEIPGRGTERPQTRSPPEAPVEKGARPAFAPYGVTSPDTGAEDYSTRRSCDGAMRGGDGERINAPLAVE